MAAAADFAVLVFAGDIFSGLAALEVAAVGHLTALLTAAAGVALIRARRPRPHAPGRPAPGRPEDPRPEDPRPEDPRPADPRPGDQLT